MNKNYFSFTILKTSIKAIRSLWVVLFCLTSIISFSQKGTFTSSGSLVVPAGVGVLIGGVVPNPLTAKCWGAGGGGGGSSLLTASGGGGGGGAFKSSTVTLVANKNNVTVFYTVGAGGAGGATASINGSAGGSTVFPSSVSPVFSYTAVTANGGSGGEGGTSLIAYGAGGSGGAAGDYKGGNGANGDNILFVGLVGGGGGGGAGSGGAGGNGNNGALNQAGGTGGTGSGGTGGSGVLLLGNGSNGSSVGGGGGGGAGLLSPISATATGGNGANGQIEVSYTCPSYSVTNVSSTSACNTFGTATITLGSSAAGLPIGTYTVTYDRTLPSATGLTATMVVETAGTGTFTATGLTTAGTSRITIKKIKSVDCETDVSASNKYADLTVNTVPVQPGTISGYSYQCAGNTFQTYSIASVPNTTSYTWTVDTASGWVITSGQNSNSITVTVGSSSANISVMAVNECGNSTASTLPVSLNIPDPTASVTLQPTCAVPTGTITITAPAPSAGISYSIDGVDYSNTTGIFTLVPIGDYTITVKYPSTCISSVANLAMTSSVEVRTWSGTWDAIPTIENKVIFTESYNEDSENLDENIDIEACSCEVRLGADVTIQSGHYLKIRNELIVDGSLTFKNGASLVQINNKVENSGDITYERDIEVNRYDYTYWSSPVEGCTLKELSKNTLFDRYFSYHPDNGWEVSKSGVAEMKAGHGYIVRAPQTYPISGTPQLFTGIFKGEPNNGVINYDVILEGDKNYLLGNPYPSAIDAEKFLDVNSDVLLGTLYFWTHNSPPLAEPGTTTYKYTASDYVPYNKTGSIASNIFTDEVGALSTAWGAPNGRIGAAQGFFAPTSTAGGEIVFNNEMRLVDEEVLDNSQFFKLGTTSKATNDIEKNRVWLNLSNVEGAFKQTLVGYISGATNEYEGKFDGISYDGNQYLDFYSINQTLNLAIQGRALPFQQKDSVALGYKSTIAGDFKISIDHADGKLATQKIFLEDKVLQVLHDLKEPYLFTTEKGIFNDRFVLRYEDKNALVETVNESAVEGVVISNQNKIITITTSDEMINAVYIYDFSGRLVYLDTEVNLETATISDISGAYQVLIVKAVLENGEKAVKKIIY